MKTLILASLLLSTTSFAQSLDVKGFKKLLTEKQSILEKVNAGMSKQTVFTSSVDVEGAACNFKQTSVQTILRVEGDKMVVLAKESFSPENSAACRTAQFEAFEESILFYEQKPTLAQDLEDLDASASAIKTISRAGDIVTVVLSISETDEDGNKIEGPVTLKYDLTKSSFKNLIYNEGFGSTLITTDLPDADVNSFDLSNVLFCENNDGDSSDCVQGNFSDILF